MAHLPVGIGWRHTQRDRKETDRQTEGGEDKEEEEQQEEEEENEEQSLIILV